MMINRPIYLNQLINLKDKEPIKVITGIRRCGKSTLSRMITRQAFEENCPVVLYSLENAPGTFVTEEVMLEYCKDTGERLNARQFEIAHTENPEKYKKYI